MDKVNEEIQALKAKIKSLDDEINTLENEKAVKHSTECDDDSDPTNKRIHLDSDAPELNKSKDNTLCKTRGDTAELQSKENELSEDSDTQDVDSGSVPKKKRRCARKQTCSVCGFISRRLRPHYTVRHLPWMYNKQFLKAVSISHVNVVNLQKILAKFMEQLFKLMFPTMDFDIKYLLDYVKEHKLYRGYGRSATIAAEDRLIMNTMCAYFGESCEHFEHQNSPPNCIGSLYHPHIVLTILQSVDEKHHASVNYFGLENVAEFITKCPEGKAEELVALQHKIHEIDQQMKDLQEHLME